MQLGSQQTIASAMWRSMEHSPVNFELVELEPMMSTDDARLLLYQRCLDAGWTRAKATRYINRVLANG